MPRLTLLSFLLSCAFAANADDLAGPTVLHADRVEGLGQAETTARGNVLVEQDGRRIEAEWMKLFSASNEIRAGDHTRLTQRQDVLEGGQLYLKDDTRTGELANPTFRMGQRNGRGDAVKLLFEGPEKYRLDTARFTTCQPGRDDWFIRARDLELDYSRNLGVARHGSIEFLGVPLLYSPYLDFTLDGSRKSGLLSPSIGSGTGGLEVTVPFYWNIAPNADATLSPRIIAKRGVLLSNEVRYLGPNYDGQLSVETILKDRMYGQRRSAVNYQHRHAFSPAWHGALNLQKTTDDRYFADFGDRIAVASQTFLPREGILSYQQDSLGAFVRVQRYQTLQDPTNQVDEPYARLPQVVMNYNRSLPNGLRLDVSTDATRFARAWSRDKLPRPEGSRYFAYPSISLPLEHAAGFITPKLGFHSTTYKLQNGTRFSRDLPIFSLDTGLFFDRESRLLGRDMVQSLEPRAYYVRIPYRDQRAFPNFDSGLADFNFAQMFSENQYTGSDRINDANQLTLAVTSRLFEADNGVERARVAIGQRFYFDDQRVTLTETARRQDVTASDLIATVGGQPLDNWWVDAAVQTDSNAHRTRKASLNLRYQPQPGKLLNLRYRMDKLTDIKQIDLSAQWPIGRNWHVVARQNWSIKDRRSLERLAGLEYNGGCWVFRMVTQRFVTSGNQTSSPFFLQLELNDLGRLGSNPLQTLKESIPGYTKLN
ncbi:LPS-assembly protein LptD [Chitinimonas arctica]|uniref:LPS-assembly protein LptD n=1 Tax=Chitinimonas arctica TaxID=2594795 RepID=A0A516SFZ6_9NEIS|nr:LPS-assembly protein LptD [Chitinimonas arctica]QDQ27084.1 LPS-assembly protein LptD [Chitinimonas arctica]